MMKAIDIKTYVEQRIAEGVQGPMSSEFNPKWLSYDVLMVCDPFFEKEPHAVGYAETDKVNSIDEAFKGLFDCLYFYGTTEKEIKTMTKHQVKRQLTYGKKGEFENYGPCGTARWANRLRYLLTK
jgi:hypothetical protein